MRRPRAPRRLLLRQPVLRRSKNQASCPGQAPSDPAGLVVPVQWTGEPFAAPAEAPSHGAASRTFSAWTLRLTRAPCGWAPRMAGRPGRRWGQLRVPGPCFGSDAILKQEGFGSGHETMKLQTTGWGRHGRAGGGREVSAGTMRPGTYHRCTPTHSVHVYQSSDSIRDRRNSMKLQHAASVTCIL